MEWANCSHIVTKQPRRLLLLPWFKKYTPIYQIRANVAT